MIGLFRQRIKGVKYQTLGKRAAATIEYATLMMLIMGAFLLFQNYILKGFYGRWRQVGDTFGHGRQYDPRNFGPVGADGGTLECIAYVNPSTKAATWYLTSCLESTCSCYVPSTCLTCANASCQDTRCL
jgi:hypothetical protein